MKTIDELLKTDYWIMDILPKQVPQNSPGQYFSVEKYFLSGEELQEIKKKHIRVILKMNCYLDLSLDDEEEINPDPARIADEMKKRYVNIRFGEALIISEKDDTHMTLFNPDEHLLELVRSLAVSEGLFVWKP